VELFLNWIWQGVLVALAAKISCRVLPLSARVEYVVWCAVLGLVVAIPLPGLIGPAGPSLAAAPAQPIDDAKPLMMVPRAAWLSSSLLIGAWIVWMTASLVRLAVVALALRRAKAGCTSVGPSVEARLANWTGVRGRRRPVRFMTSDEVASAAVLGFSRPIIAVNPVLLQRLRDDELDQVVIHEWAHVQRRDDVANLVQCVIQALVGWHPAAWWIDRELSRTREAACDAFVVAMTGSAKVYARSLVKLARLPRIGRYAWSALAAVSSSRIEERIVRILALDRARDSAWSSTSGMVLVSMLAALTVSTNGVRLIAVDLSGEPIPESSELSHGVAGDVRPRGSRDTRLDPGATVAAPLVAIDRPRSARPIPPRAATSGASAGANRAIAQSPAGAQAEPDVPVIVPIASQSHTATLTPLPHHGAVFSEALPADDEPQSLSPWSATAQGGIAIGRGSQRTATAMAGFFTRVSKKIVGSF
jgi:beta-lactamase regulating signal transducer with metallopeptidase domain